jgi:hypothetical protein
MSTIQKKFPARPITLCNRVCIGIKRRRADSEDISGVLTYANILTSTANNAWNARGSVTLLFEGYDADSRELYEIREVRAYVKKLAIEWRSWMYFVDNSMNSFIALCLCLVEVRRTANPKKTEAIAGSDEVLTCGFEGINDLCEHLGFPEEICEDESQRVAIALGIGSRLSNTSTDLQVTSAGIKQHSFCNFVGTELG